MNVSSEPELCVQDSNEEVVLTQRSRPVNDRGLDRRKASHHTKGISIVVPLYNERENIRPLIASLLAVTHSLGVEWEIILVDDGSNDGSAKELAELASDKAGITVVELRRNTGQTAALMAGFDLAHHDVVVTLDGDLQNDPSDIPNLLAELEKGFDVVSGWRKHRFDDVFRRTLPSRVANWLISRISGVKLHDYGCTLKAYRRDVLDGVRLYGEMHRFIPIYARWKGARVCEIPVKHHPRKFGESKYGLNRIYKVMLDLLVVKFLMDYQTRPIHVFGAAGFICFGLAFVSGIFALYLRFWEGISFIQTPMPLLVVMAFITGMMCILLGLLAELLVRIYYEGNGHPAYDIRKSSRDGGMR